jgi:hypothetical protein
LSYLNNQPDPGELSLWLSHFADEFLTARQSRKWLADAIAEGGVCRIKRS